MLKIKHNQTNKNILRNQKGMAILEAVSLLVIFTMLVTYALGYWGAIHTATLHSISARTYAFDTFRNRSNTVYHRDSGPILNNMALGFRHHGIDDHERTKVSSSMYATKRPIAFGREFEPLGDNAGLHNSRVYEISGRNREGGVEVNPIWIKVGYGLCVTASCGGDL